MSSSCLVGATKFSIGAISGAQRNPVVITHEEVLHVEHCEPNFNSVACRHGDIPFAVQVIWVCVREVWGLDDSKKAMTISTAS